MNKLAIVCGVTAFLIVMYVGKKKREEQDKEIDQMIEDTVGAIFDDINKDLHESIFKSVGLEP